MSRKLKVGVVGTGNIYTNAHAKAWEEHPEIEVAAVCDANPQLADAAGKLHGITACYTDYRTMLANENLDIVDICTPNLYRSEIAIAALKSGVHVFCEKPDAISPEEARKMAETAKESGKVLMAMRNNRFNPGSAFLKRFVDEGYMGEIYTGRCGWVRRRGIPGKGGWFTTKELSGGGPLIDLGVHFIDLAIWLMGNPKPVSVAGATYRKFDQSNLSDSVHSKFGQEKSGGTFDVEDLATGFIRFENQATLQIEFSWASNIEEEMNFVELRGTKAGASLKKGEVKLFNEMAGALCDITPRLPKKEIGDHASHIHHFVDVVQGRAEPILTPEHGVDMIKILFAIYESSRIGAEVRL